MELFTRDLVLTGPPTELRSWAVATGAAFTDATDKPIHVWTSVAGARAGTFTWAMPIDGTAELLELTAAAMATPAYLEQIESGRDHLTDQPIDAIMRPYFGDVPTDDSRVGSVCTVVRATSRSGSLGHAVGWGQELADYSTQLTGVTTTLYGTVAGSFSQLVWIAVTDDARGADEMDRTLKTDDEYRKLIGRGGGYFMSGSARTTMHLRIA